MTLCGSTKFKSEFELAQRELSIEGKIVLTVAFYIHAGYGGRVDQKIKRDLDELHLDKIEMSDEVFVINKDGYIGESTRNEIRHAEKMKKKVRYMFPIGNNPLQW